ncbi:MAG: hypothetical protein ACYDEF_15450 [Methanosarcina sp.]
MKFRISGSGSQGTALRKLHTCYSLQIGFYHISGGADLISASFSIEVLDKDEV